MPVAATSTSSPSAPLPPRAALLRAFYEGDSGAEGAFIVAVKTTGIFCRPTCRARKPLPENVTFYADPIEALHGGFRPCKLCRPLDAVPPVPPLLATLRELVENTPDHRVSEKDLAAAGVTPSTARRLFQKHHGMTFQAYQRARRLGTALKSVQEGRSVTEAQASSGFSSATGFRAASSRAFGRAPRAAAATIRLLAMERFNTPLGTMIAVADDAGLHVLDFVDRRGLERHLGKLGRTLGARLVPGPHPILAAAANQIGEYFSGQRSTFDLPLAPRGSDWEHAVWEALRGIPPGETRGYGSLAAQLGKPGAARAVGRANGMNYLAIIIPCHRVIRSDGSLCGYGGGLWRKQWLLAHERRYDSSAAGNA